jgi:cytoskeletal protein RodZ
MTSVGRLLQSARLEQGRDLGAIADEMCITRRYLHAIENDDLETLPGMFFYRSFVKQYAVLLGIEPGWIRQILEATIAQLENPGNGESALRT